MEKIAVVNEFDCFNRYTSEMFKGIAIIFLLVGHYSAFCLEGAQPFEMFGEIAVIIFLFLSGVGLTKSYGFNKIDKIYLVKRLRRIMIPLWLTLALFYFLDFLLLNKVYSILDILPQFTGILRKSSPNGAAWFISYILYLYIIFYAISNIRIRLYSKVILLFLLCYLTNKSIINVPMLNHFFGGWNTYTFVFPMSILVALNENHFSRLLKKCDEISPTLVFFILIIIIFIYLTAEMFRTGYLIMLISAAAFLVSSTRLKVNLLKWIGSYSYEIYLLHLPFLSSYSFLGEQLPQSLRIIIYITLLVILSIGLKRLSFTLIDFIFPYLAEK